MHTFSRILFYGLLGAYSMIYIAKYNIGIFLKILFMLTVTLLFESIP